VCYRCELTSELKKDLKRNIEELLAIDDDEAASEHNMIVLMCLIVELFMLPHANISVDNMPLSSRLQRAYLYFESEKFPTTVKHALDYLFKSLAKPVKLYVTVATCKLT